MNTLTPATISKIITMADKSIRLTVDTQELTPEAMAEVFALYGKYGYFMFNENEEIIEATDLPPIVIDKGEKTKSERLRAVLFRLWEQTSMNKCTFQQYYDFKMDELINNFKSKLI